jgi:UDP-N-acetylmuramoyl-L-alanyl-D-glutamate--2,6-diaminopimelate ligase
MIVIWVTGTKGKSTTTNLIARWLEAAGKKVCMFSTVNLCLDGNWWANPYKMTSPDPFVLQKFLAEGLQSGAEYAVIEVSSHALFYSRVYGIDFDVAVFTNLSQDHLDLHGTMEEYAKTKLKLFTGLAYGFRKKGIKKVSVVNIDDAYSEEFLKATVDTLYTFWNSANAQVRALDIQSQDDGMSFTVKMPSHTFPVKTHLFGAFNVSNILAAIAVLISQKIDTQAITHAVSELQGIAWRLQEISVDLPCRVFVDYAHTEESLKQVLSTLRELPGCQRIITVFGATWDRDRSKRPKMGAIVHALSDIVLLTEDDNYTEEQFQIMSEVSQGIKRKEGDDFWIIFHREDAIRTALLSAQEGDIVLLAGKGAEEVIVRNAGAEPWSDGETARRIAREIGQNRLVSR